MPSLSLILYYMSTDSWVNLSLALVLEEEEYEHKVQCTWTLPDGDVFGWRLNYGQSDQENWEEVFFDSDVCSYVTPGSLSKLT